MRKDPSFEQRYQQAYLTYGANKAEKQITELTALVKEVDQKLSPREVGRELIANMRGIVDEHVRLIHEAESETVRMRAIEEAYDVVGAKDVRTAAPHIQQNFLVLYGQLDEMRHQLEAGQVIDGEFVQVEEASGS